jgi:glycosyltransferase involved in cell wall biosynthesis
MRFAFVSTLANTPWGGSEELWSRTAERLAEAGCPVAASVQGRSPPHPRIAALSSAGVAVASRPTFFSVWRRLRRRVSGSGVSLAVADFHRWLDRCRPSLVVLAEGRNLPPVELIEACIERRLAFVTIGQSNAEGWWFHDDAAARYRAALPKARRCYFVSEANRRLAEKQVGGPIENAEVVFNPFNVPFTAAPAWPGDDGPLRLACVGRLEPASKGQDLLFEALAAAPWTERDWRLTVFGEGPVREGLERLAAQLGLSERVSFAGQVADVEAIWRDHHLLALPSRHEGLPLVVVEAMLCARPVLATDVAGAREVIEDGVTGFLAAAPTVGALSAALERAWARRADLRQMGRDAAEAIRRRTPADPVAIFAQKLRRLAACPA